MVYIDATLSNCNGQYKFHTDADDMKQLMDNAQKIISNVIYRIGKFDIVSFQSNTINMDNFQKLIEIYLTKKREG